MSVMPVVRSSTQEDPYFRVFFAPVRAVRGGEAGAGFCKVNSRSRENTTSSIFVSYFRAHSWSGSRLRRHETHERSNEIHEKTLEILNILKDTSEILS